MKNKKGFTLIELLAVIVILAIITLITVPVIGNIIEKSKKDAFERSIEGLSREYAYKEVQTDDKLGEVNACTLQEECKLQGIINRDSNNDIIVTISNGKYCGAGKIGDLTITEGRCDINLGTANVSDISPVDYDGTAHEPVVEVVLGGVTLVKDIDYEVSYENNINAGEATITITGKGDYKGSITKTFTINRIEAPNSEILGATLTYNGLSQSLITSVNVSNGNVYYNVGTELNSNNYNTLGSLERPSEANAGTYTVYYYAPVSGNYKEIKGSVVSVINKLSSTMYLSSYSKTYYLGENGTITVTGSNYGTLTCSSSNEAKVTCSVEDSTIIVTPISAGSATLTITGSGNENYNEISKTHSATIKVLPTIDSCPGCVYAANDYQLCWSPLNTSRSCVNASESGTLYYGTYYYNTLSSYTRDYTTLGRRVFLGYVIDENNRVEKAYACMKRDNDSFCLEGMLSTSVGGNSSDMSSIYNSNILMLENYCVYDDYYHSDVIRRYKCRIDNPFGYIYITIYRESGDVSADYNVNSGNMCTVFGAGRAYCTK